MHYFVCVCVWPFVCFTLSHLLAPGKKKKSMFAEVTSHLNIYYHLYTLSSRQFHWISGKFFNVMNYKLKSNGRTLHPVLSRCSLAEAIFIFIFNFIFISAKLLLLVYADSRIWKHISNVFLNMRLHFDPTEVEAYLILLDLHN